MISCKVVFLAAAIMIITAGAVRGQEQKVDPRRQMTSTVTGGTSTGAYNTWSPLTLKRGEYQVGVFADNYDRDPGDLDIYRLPFNITVGLANRWEVFANVDFLQKVTTRIPLSSLGPFPVLSGFQLSGLTSQFGGNPLAGLGQPVITRGAAFFPNGGAAVGGVLPTPGTFFGPVVITDRPVYFNDLPFYGPATFNPATLTYSPEPTANGLGNVTLGTKVKLWEGGSRHHAISIAGILRLPTTTSFRGLSSGRGTGEIDFGPILIYGTQYAGGRIRLNTNLGYIHSGDPSNGDVKYLDRRNQLMANAALEGAPNEHLVVFAEWNNVVYVGNGTPNLNPVNPMDVFLGGRAFLKEGRIQFGGGWRRFINPLSNRFVTALVPGGGTALLPLQSGDHNGFTFSFGFGRRLHKTVPPPVNAPPTVALDADKPCVPSGGNINFTARGSDPDNDVLIYTWSTSAGKLTGSGADTVLDTTGLNERPGSAQVDVTVGVTVDDGRGGVATASRRVCVTAPDAPPPAKNRAPRIQSVRCMVVGTPQVEGRVTDGESVRVMVTATDPDGDPLQYSYSTNAGRLSGRGSEEILDTAGVTSGPGGQPVPVTVSVVVNDGRGGSDLGSCTVTVYALGKPEAERLGGGREIRFRRNDARVDNVAKAVLDDVALRLQQDPRATAVLDGHTEKGEPASLGLRRAENAKRYLVRDRHVDATRIAVRNFGAEGADAASRDGQNRRVDVWIVPQGAELPPGPVSAPRRSQ